MMAFRTDGSEVVPLKDSDASDLIGESEGNRNLNMRGLGGEIFFNNQILGQFKILDREAECFRILSAEEEKQKEACLDKQISQAFAKASKKQEKAEPEKAILCDSFNTKIQCPDLDSKESTIQVTKKYSEDPYFRAALHNADLKKINKAFASRIVKFEWGFLGDLQTQHRPLLATTKMKLKDNEKWGPIKDSEIPTQIKQQILREVLKTRAVQKCTNEDPNLTQIVLSQNDLMIENAYRTKDKLKYAVPVRVRSIPQLPECNDNELGVPSAFVIYQRGKAVDLLAEASWNYRDFEVLEAVDLNDDGVSELVLTDKGYNRDGFAIYDLKSQKIVEFGDSSH